MWFKNEPRFYWLNMAPGGQRLPTADVATHVAQWFTKDSPLPKEWDGRSLQDLVGESKRLRVCNSHTVSHTHTHGYLQTVEEKRILMEYSDKHCKPLVFSDPAKVDDVLQQIESSLQTRT